MTVFNRSKSVSFILSAVMVLGLIASLSLLCFAGGETPVSAAAYKTTVIDISEWQPTVNWSQTAAVCDGVILRIGYRRTQARTVCEDYLFASHYAGASSKGMNIGCYFYSAATTEAEGIEEADFVISTIQKYKCSFTMPIYFDTECDEQRALSKSQLTKVAKAFCDRLKAKGYLPGVYCSKNWAINDLDMSQLSGYTFWLAEYASAPTYTGAYDMWQKTSKGNIAGISGNVDVNECYRDFPKFIKENGYNGFVPETTAGETTTGGETTTTGDGTQETTAPSDSGEQSGFFASLIRLIKLVYEKIRSFFMSLVGMTAIASNA